MNKSYNNSFNNTLNNTKLRDMFEYIDFDDLDSETNIETKVNKKHYKKKIYMSKLR